MDGTELMSIQPTSLIPLDGLSAATLGKRIEKRRDYEIDEPCEEKKKQIAKDFESILINKLLDQVKNTIGQWDFGSSEIEFLDQDGLSQQMQGIFWLYLAQDIANKGGFGLWKDLYEFMTLTDTDRKRTDTDSDGLSESPCFGRCKSVFPL